MEFLVSDTFYANQQDNVRSYIISKHHVERLLIKLSGKEQNTVLHHEVGFCLLSLWLTIL